MQWGTTRALVNNMVAGVSKGFTKNLEINGVGYRAAVQGKNLVLQLGLQPRSHLPDPGRRQDHLREADLDHDHRRRTTSASARSRR